MNKQKLIDSVKKVLNLLIENDFDALYSNKMLGPSTKNEYMSALSIYLRGRESLANIPDIAFDAMDIIDFCDIDNKNKWRVDCDLWTDRGLSDLTAQIYVWEEEDGTYHSMLYDLRVL